MLSLQALDGFKLFLVLAQGVYSLQVAQRQVAVIGASGKLGSRVVESCLERGYKVKCLLRSGTPIPGTETVIGDVSNVTALEELLRDSCICLGAWGAVRRTELSDLWRSTEQVEAEPGHAKIVNYDGVANLLQAAEAMNCTRIVRITGQNENPFSPFAILINGFGSFAKAYNYEGEALLRTNSQIDYTIIRPGIMVEDDSFPRRLTLRDNGGKLPISKISYAAIADLMCDLIEYPHTRRCTLVAMSNTRKSVNAPDSWIPLLLNSVAPDRRKFPQSLLSQNRLAVRIALTMALTLPFLLGYVIYLILSPDSLSFYYDAITAVLTSSSSRLSCHHHADVCSTYIYQSSHYFY